MRSISGLSVVFALIWAGKAASKNPLPNITLPYGTWQAASLDQDDDVCITFRKLTITDYHGSFIHLQTSASVISPVDSKHPLHLHPFPTLRRYI